jgi:diadenosine tetraphosphate (Ap4A) HIT family hydrolase
MTSPDPKLSCPLCTAAGQPALWSNDKLFVIAVPDPDYPGYTRVIWRAHVPEMSDLSAADRHHVMDVVDVVEQTQRALLNPDKINLAAFGNMVPHLHWHVIPRWRDDRHFPDAVWAPARIASGAESPAFAAHRQETAGRLDSYHMELAQRLSAGFR